MAGRPEGVRGQDPAPTIETDIRPAMIGSARGRGT